MTVAENSDCRLLVVDDQAAICRLFYEIFTERGLQVEVAYDADDAIAKIPRFTPTLILLDLNMPGRSGLEAIHDIKSISDAPVVMVTAYGDLNMVQEAKEEGLISDYITKPFDIALLDHLVDHMRRSDCNNR